MRREVHSKRCGSVLGNFRKPFEEYNEQPGIVPAIDRIRGRSGFREPCTATRRRSPSRAALSVKLGSCGLVRSLQAARSLAWGQPTEAASVGRAGVDEAKDRGRR